MTALTHLSLSVPATTANIGPGFDCLGAALSLANGFHFRLIEDGMTISVQGKEANKVIQGKENLLYHSFAYFYQKMGQNPPPIAIEIELGVPLARGLGSSATAIVGGVVAANEFAGKPLNQTEIMELVIELEGHPDNVVPALMGGCQLCVGEAGNWQICEIPWHSEIIPVVAIPDFELSTEAARSVLPLQYPRSDAIFNAARLGLLLQGLSQAHAEWLFMAMKDKIHQPYRQGLIQGYQVVQKAALDAGAYGMVISGAGPTLLALTTSYCVNGVVSAMKTAWEREGIQSDVQALAIDTLGVQFLSR